MEYMKEAKKLATSEFVFSIPENAPYKNFYDAYMWRLRKYCKECGMTKIATHGLRHSTASIYLEYEPLMRICKICFHMLR